MKIALEPSKICFPVVGATCLMHGVQTDAGVMSLLYIIGGAFLLGLVMFEVDVAEIGRVGIFGLSAIALVGSAAWIGEKWGGDNWVLAYAVPLFWVFAFVGYLLTLSTALKAGRSA